MKLTNLSNKLFAIVLLCTFSSLSSQALYAQDFSSLDSDLQSLENLMNDIIANTEQQQKLLQDLNMNLEESVKQATAVISEVVVWAVCK